MRAHIITNGVVTNTIEVESLDFLPNLVEATEGSIGWSYANGVFTPPVILPTIPAEVSPRQIRQALTQVGLRAGVEAAVAAGSQDLKDWWEFATSFERQHPMVLAMAQGLGVTEQQLDDLFVLAASL